MNKLTFFSDNIKYLIHVIRPRDLELEEASKMY